jgi:uncharacterized protein (TIGR00730 family)
VGRLAPPRYHNRVTNHRRGRPRIERVCVFCGSSPGNDPIYLETARSVGRFLAQERLGVVFGGGGVGLMGALADAAMAAGGQVTGVIPEQLMARELGHSQLSELRVVSSMHARKALMMELGDAFIGLPGGAGTLDELSEVWTWSQLGIHDKPCGILNVHGYFDPLIAFLDQMVTEGFLSPAHREMVLVDTDPAVLLKRFRHYQPPEVPQWLRPSGV